MRGCLIGCPNGRAPGVIPSHVDHGHPARVADGEGVQGDQLTALASRRATPASVAALTALLAVLSAM
jgi:hypothetical protein